MRFRAVKDVAGESLPQAKGEILIHGVPIPGRRPLCVRE
jgi:hypothetical protein